MQLSNKLAIPPNKFPRVGCLVCPAAIKSKDKGAPEHFTEIPTYEPAQAASKAQEASDYREQKHLDFISSLAPLSPFNRLPREENLLLFQFRNGWNFC